MNRYELTFLVNKEEEVKTLSELLQSLSGKIVKEKNWGARQLAYPINKLTSALYYTWVIDVKKNNVLELKKKLNFNENLIRYLLLSSDSK